jgi:hypothetical protein
VNRTGLAFFLLFVILTRLPFVFAGFGTDPDAWRVAASATKLWQTGTYEVSRYPGYPLHELVTAPLVVLGGAPLSNGGTLLCSVFLLIFWHRIAIREGRYPTLLLIIFAFTPLFWKNTATTMDYTWSLLFILLSLDHAMQKRAVAAGVFLGIAVGFRAANLIALFPLGVLLLEAKEVRRSLVTFTLFTAVVGMACYIPVALAIGPSAWITSSIEQVASVRGSQDLSLAISGYRGIYAIGPLAALFGLWIIVWQHRNIRLLLIQRDRLVMSACAALLVFGAQFAALPMEREYILPLLPFVLLALDRIVSRGTIVAMGVLLVSYGFVNPDLVEHGGLTGRIHPNVRWGVMIEEWQKHGERERIRSTILSLHPTRVTLVMTGFPNSFWFREPRIDTVASPFHELVYRNKADTLMHHTLLLSREEIALARKAGFTVCVLEGAQRFVEQAGRYSLEGEQIATVP